MSEVTLATVQDAAARLKGVIVRTPLKHSDSLSHVSGRALYLKAENLQRTGSFKIRGAYNKVSRLSPEEQARGVIAASAGNHAQGVALAAQMLGVRATIVMPEDAALPKVMATKGYGAKVVLHGATYDAAYARARELEREQGLTYVHAFNDPHIVSGQGTTALEVLEDLPSVDLLVIPIGGGGLISGMAVAAKTLRPDLRIVGVQAEGAPAMYETWRKGEPVEIANVNTIADGLAIKRPEGLTIDLIKRYVDDMVLVSEQEIARAIMLLLERTKLLAEGSGAVTVAAALAGKLPAATHTVALISGGNVDLNRVARIIDHGLAEDGRYLQIRTSVSDRPGGLHRLLGVVAQARANVVTVEHDRLSPDIHMGDTGVRLLVEARDREHAEAIREALKQAGYPQL